MVSNIPKERNSNIIIFRQKALQDIKHEDYEKGTRLKNTQIIQKMKKMGYADYNPRMFYRDSVNINKHSTFTQDLITTSYSAYVEQVFSRLSGIEEDAQDVIAKKWTQDKIVTTTNDTDQGMTSTVTTVITEEIASPKLDALKILLKLQEIKHNIITGDSGMNLSQVMLEEKFQTMETEIKRLQAMDSKKEEVHTKKPKK